MPEKRNLRISTLRNDGSIDITWDDYYYNSDRFYFRSLNLSKSELKELLIKYLGD